MATVADVRKKLERKYLKGAGDLFPPINRTLDLAVIPSSSPIIDAVVGVGGFPRGRIVEIWGPESTGKTTILLEAMARLYRLDPEAVCLFVDFEHALDLRYAAGLGVPVLDEDRFILCQPAYFEQGATTIREFVTEGLVDIVGIDSVAAMIPLSGTTRDLDPNRDKPDGHSSRGQAGLHAALVSDMCNWLTKSLNTGRKPACIAINQPRTKLNLRTGHSSLEATGGLALKFYSAIRLQLGRAKVEGESTSGEVIDEAGDRVRVDVTCIKNKVAPPWRKGKIVIGFGSGIDDVESTVDLATMYLDIQSGSWFRYKGQAGEMKVQGRPAAVEFLRDNPDLCREIEEASLEHLKNRTALEQPHRTPSTEPRQKKKHEVKSRRRGEAPPKTDGLGTVD